MKKYEAIIFDLDGTIVDTNGFVKDAIGILLKNRNIDLSSGELEEFIVKIGIKGY